MKNFTQDEVNALLAAERRKHEAKHEALRQQLADHERVKAELVQAAADLEARAARAEAATAEQAQRLEAAGVELQNARDAHTQAVESHRAERLGRLLGEALVAERALASGLPFATAELQRSVQVEYSADGRPVAFQLDGQRHTDARELARAFLTTRDFLLAAKPGGSGTRQPNGVPGPRDLSKVSPADLASEGWKVPPR
jgi:seryl-tRNA synthetase